MFKQYLILVSLSLVTMVSPASAQGEFLKPGESGFGVAVERSLAYPSDANSFSAGFSIDGYLDMGLSVMFLDGRNSTAQAPYVAISLLKQGYKGLPLSLQVTAGYCWYTQSFDREDFLLGASLSTNIGIVDRFLLQPAVSFSAAIPAESSWRGTNSAMSYDLTAGVRVTQRAMALIHYGVYKPDGPGASFYGQFGIGLVFRTSGN